MLFPDISEYYKGERVAVEEKAWAKVKEYKRNLAQVLRSLATADIKRVIEVGCGSGLIAAELPKHIEYLGVDKNAEFLALAQRKSPNRQFINEDVRNVTPEWLEANGYGKFDMVCSFAFVKHFGLHEWDNIVGGILALAPRACFDVSITKEDYDNGKHFHHTYVTQERLNRVLDKAGHKQVHAVIPYDDNIAGEKRWMQIQIITTVKV
jgi:predicted TPR repeat methyltransferase